MLGSLGGTAKGPVCHPSVEKRRVWKERRSKGKWAARTCKALLAIIRIFLLFSVGWEGIKRFWKKGSQELTCVFYDWLMCSE